jgi:ATP-dependent Clp protease ATP-binding subunit ClpC
MMPKINVYLPDDLAAAVKAAGLPVSPICQKALADAVASVSMARKAIAAIRDPNFDPDRFPQLATRLIGRMTDRLKRSLALARDAAGPAPLVMTNHLLVGLMDEGQNLAVGVLRAMEIDTDEVREAAAGVPADETGASAVAGTADGAGSAVAGAAPEVVTPVSSGSSDATGTAGVAAAGDGGLWSGLSMPARVSIGAALEASIELGHNYVGCEHLLIGLVDDGSSAAGQVLRGAGIEAAAARRAVTAALAGFVQARRGGAPAGSGSQLDEVVRRLAAIEGRLTNAGL